MTDKEAIEILKDMNDGYTFASCRVCISDNKYSEKEGICKSKTCEYLQAIDTILLSYEVLCNELDKKNEEIEELKDRNEFLRDLRDRLIATIKDDYIEKQKIQEKIDECIPKGKNLITGEEEYQPNANANSFLTHEILKLLKGEEE